MQPLFPDIDVSRFLENPVGNGLPGLPPDEPVGVMAGLNASLLAILANFAPGDLGVCVVDEKLQLSLPIDHWAEWSWLESGTTASLGAGLGTAQEMFRVPEDERAQLLAARMIRSSGDNTIDDLLAVFPAGYFPAGQNADLIVSLPDTALSGLYWPELKDDKSAYVPPPILLEPGSRVRFMPSGAGVSATVWTYKVLLLRTKMVRALAP